MSRPQLKKKERFDLRKAKATVARGHRPGKARPKPKQPWAGPGRKKSAKVKTQRSIARRLVVGTLRGTGRVLFRTVPRGTRRMAVRTKQWAQQQAARQKFDDGYAAEPDEMPYRARRLGQRYECRPCRRVFRTGEGLAGHFDRVHEGEEPETVRAKDPTKIIQWMTGPNAGKIRVVPGGATAPGGRHRSGDRPKKTYQQRVAEANRAAINKIGDRAVTEIEPLNTIYRGFQQLAEMPLVYHDDRPFLPLSELKAIAAGLEKIMGGVAVEAMSNLRARMINAGFSPAQSNALLGKGEQFAELGSGFTAWIAQLIDELQEQIKAARIVSGSAGPSTESLVS